MEKKKKYGGVVVPMITPFTQNEEIDLDAVEKIVEHLLQENCQPFVLGTTGESSSVSFNEKLKLVKATVLATKGRTLVYAGISGNCFSESVNLAEQFSDLGADVAVAHVPGYYALEQDQILDYFHRLASTIPLPLIIYNMPATTHISIAVETAEILSKHENIVGIKDSERGLDRMKNSISLWKNREDFSFLIGWAAKSYEALKMGADGIVPSSGNLIPRLYALIPNSLNENDDFAAQKAQEKADTVSKIYQQHQPLSKSFPYFKAMMSKYNLCQKYVLPPLQTLNEEETIMVGEEIVALGKGLNELNQIKNDSV